MNYRTIYLSLGILGILSLQTLCDVKINDVSHLATARVKKIYAPASIEELKTIVGTTKGPIAIAGGRFSQGGHIWAENGIIIDTKNLNAISLDAQAKTVTVQAGATWRQVQEAIDPHNLSIKVMQSYSDFTIGGSLSVNVHGRMLMESTLIETVISIKLMLADGSIVTASRSENSELFAAAIGGYGAIGIILEATLSLTENQKLERHEVIMPLSDYPTYFKNIIAHDPAIKLHNANISVTDYSTISSISWHESRKSLTITDRLTTHNFLNGEHIAFQVVRYVRSAQKMRMPLQIMKNAGTVVWRNYEMSTPVSAVEPTSRLITTSILQEYFIPCDRFEEFVHHLHRIAKNHSINIMNISVRSVRKDHDSLMAYGQAEESFALVLYINMRNSAPGIKKATIWTRQLIDAALSCNGTYYLPYQPYATKHQFQKAYPRTPELLAIKNRVDPQHRFMNNFIQQYIL